MDREHVDDVHEGLRLTLQALQDLHSTCAALGARRVVLEIPSKEHVYAPWLPPGQRPADELPWHHRQVRARCEELGILCVPLVRALRARIRAGEQPFFVWDPHWNAEGSHVAAQALVDALR